MNESLEDELEKKARKNNIPVIRQESGQFLERIVKEKQPKKILEFGTAVGFSAIKMLVVSNKSQLVTIELNPERAKDAKDNIKKAGFSKNCKVITGNDLEVSQKLIEQNEKFDFIFLDSAKGQYVNLIEPITKLLVSGGTLVADNVLFRGYVYGECPRRFKTIAKRLKDFIELMSNSKEYKDVEVLNIEDGILIATKV